MSNLILLPIIDDIESEIPSISDTMVRQVALKIYESVNGFRPLEQLANWVSPHIIARLSLVRNLQTERDEVYSLGNAVLPMPGRVLISEFSPTRVFTVVALHSSPRAAVIMMTFDYNHTRWRASEVNLL